MNAALMDAATRGPQVETLGDAFARMRQRQMQEEAAAQARQIGAQQLTLGNLQNQEAQMKIAAAGRSAKGDAALSAYMTGGPPAPAQAVAAPPSQATAPTQMSAPGSPDSAATNGAAQTPTPTAPPAPPKARPLPTLQQIMGFYTGDPAKGADVHKKLMDAEASGVDLKSRQSKLGAEEAEYFGNLALMVRAADYSADAIEQSLNMMEDHGHPEQAAQLRAHIAKDPTAAKALFDRGIDGSPKAKDEVRKDAERNENAAAAKRKIDEDAATLTGKKTTNEQNARVLAGTSATGITAEQKTQNDATAARDLASKNNSAAHLRIAQDEHKRKTEGALGMLSPVSKGIAEKLAVGDFDPALLGRMPDKEAIVSGAIALNPAWTPQVYAAKKSFTDPEKMQAKNLGTISRIVGHIGRFEANSKELGYAPAYALLGMNQTGAQNKLNNDTHAISAELEKLVSGGVGSQAQTQAWEKALKAVAPGPRQQAIDEISQLIGSQYEGMNQTYKAAIGSDLPTEKYVSAAGRAWMRSKGINVTGAAEPDPQPAAAAKPAGAPAARVSVTDPNGKVHTFPTQAAADQFKRDAGIK